MPKSHYGRKEAGGGGKTAWKGKVANADTRKPKHSKDANRPSKGVMGQRSASTVRRLEMYNQRPTRDKTGKLIHEALQSKELPSTRIIPDRRWFGNTRVIGQKQLDEFRNEMSVKVNDAYTVLLREKKLPMQLLEDFDKVKRKGASEGAPGQGRELRANLLTTQPFESTFGPGRKRKRPTLAAESLSSLLEAAEKKEEGFEEEAPADHYKEGMRDRAFEKGTSKRIWGELYKVLDSSDVVIQAAACYQSVAPIDVNSGGNTVDHPPLGSCDRLRPAPLAPLKRV